MKGILCIISFIILSTQVFAQKAATLPKGAARKGYDIISPYNRKGWAKVERDKKIGYIDRNGQEVVPCRYDDIYPYEKGVAKVLLNGKFGLITDVADAEPLVEPKYDYIGQFKNGLALVALNGRRLQLIPIISLSGKAF